MAVIFIFIDGVGIGQKTKANPFFLNTHESFQILSDGNFFQNPAPVITDTHLYKGIDANLGIEGLPQSGTGQATLFSGHNASELIGRHFGPYPHSKTKFLLQNESIFKAVRELGKRPYFANAYPPIFFEMSERKNRWSCTTLMAKSAGLPLNTTRDVLDERALTAEIVQNIWRERLNINIPVITEEDAARRLLNIAADYDLVLYEYYLTDKAGHSQRFEDAETVLKRLDRFFYYLLKHIKSEDTLVITSDHGNLEDLSTKTHTRNEVPLFVFGKDALAFSQVESLTGVKKAVIDSISSRE